MGLGGIAYSRHSLHVAPEIDYVLIVESRVEGEGESRIVMITIRCNAIYEGTRELIEIPFANAVVRVRSNIGSEERPQRCCYGFSAREESLFSCFPICMAANTIGKAQDVRATDCITLNLMQRSLLRRCAKK